MADKTTYVVETKYEVKDDASHKLEGIGHAAHEAHEHAEGLRDTLHEVGEAFLLFEGVEKAKELFVGFNSTLEQTKIKLTSVVGATFKQSWDQAGDAAAEFYERYEQFAESFPVSAQELAANTEVLAGAIGQAGGNMEDLKKIVEGGAVAQKAFGLETQGLMRMLHGQVGPRNFGAMALLNTLGMSAEQWKNLTNESRMKLTEKAMQSETLKKAGAEFADSFAGQAAMLKDKLEVAAGKIGLPLFRALTKEIGSWNEWLDKNKAKIQEVSEKIASGLVTGFKYIKDVAEFIYDHSEIFITLAKAWVGIKLGGAAVDIGKSVFASVGGAFKAGGSGIGVGSIGPAAQALGAGYAIGTALDEATGASHEVAKAFAWLNGQSIELGNRFEQVVKESEEISRAMREGTEAAKGRSGAAGTTAAGRLEGLAGVEMEAIHKLTAKIAGVSLAQTGEGMMALAAHRLSAAKLSALRGGAVTTTDREIAFALSHMSADQKAHLDVAKATERIMEKQLQEFYKTGHFMTQEQVNKELAESKKIESEQAKINQTINVHIEQVSAKDPDRWIADLDDYAARRARSRTRARGALARGH